MPYFKLCKFLHGIVIIIILSFSISCQKKNESKISSAGESESHNMGRNCMDCHKKGGEGSGWFTVAGTVYDTTFTKTNPNGTVYLYSGKNATGSLIKTIEVDGNGNFYTTESVDFGSGIYPIVISSKGNKKIMSNSITTGACNSCHNYPGGTYKIYVN